MSLRDALAASPSRPFPRAEQSGLVVEATAQSHFNLYGNTNLGRPFAHLDTALLLDYLKSTGLSLDTGWSPR